MQIWHHCYWKYPDGTTVPQTSKNKFELLYEFEAVEDCGHWAPASVNTPNERVISTIARKFLLSSPTFLASNCDDVVSSREAVFREFDKYPLDGKLSFDEIERAFLSYDVDTSYLNHLQNTGAFEDVLLSQVILSPTFPFLCLPKDPVPEVVVNKITYPVMDTQEEECAANNEKLDLKWDYNLELNTERDFACVYADGLLYRKIPGEEIKTKKAIEDTRPSLGVGSKAVRLVSQISFDDKSETDKFVAKSGVSLTSCGDGLKCLKRAGSIFHPSTPSGSNCDETLRGENGKGYRGCQTKTRGGYTCQSWSEQSPHAHGDITPQSKPNDGLNSNNYCRNPGGEGESTIWCYTTNKNKRWDYCDPRVNNGIVLTDQPSMQMSAVMTWVRLYQSNSYGNIWYAREQDPKYEKKIRHR
jgi:hypothetical protein